MQWSGQAVGITGYVAKGLVFAGAGLLVIIASLHGRPVEGGRPRCGGQDARSGAFGKFLLILAALGIAAFGAYSFVRSKHGRM